jgi:hypothetical protein
VAGVRVSSQWWLVAFLYPLLPMMAVLLQGAQRMIRREVLFGGKDRVASTDFKKLEEMIEHLGCVTVNDTASNFPRMRGLLCWPMKSASRFLCSGLVGGALSLHELSKRNIGIGLFFMLPSFCKGDLGGTCCTQFRAVKFSGPQKLSASVDPSLQ